jgi:hypothetical protein
MINGCIKALKISSTSSCLPVSMNGSPRKVKIT